MLDLMNKVVASVPEITLHCRTGNRKPEPPPAPNAGKTETTGGPEIITLPENVSGTHKANGLAAESLSPFPSERQGKQRLLGGQQ